MLDFLLFHALVVRCLASIFQPLARLTLCSLVAPMSRGTHTETHIHACTRLAYKSHSRRRGVAQAWPAYPRQHLDTCPRSHHAEFHKHVRPHGFVGTIALVFPDDQTNLVAHVAQNHRRTRSALQAHMGLFSHSSCSVLMVVVRSSRLGHTHVAVRFVI